MHEALDDYFGWRVSRERLHELFPIRLISVSPSLSAHPGVEMLMTFSRDEEAKRESVFERPLVKKCLQAKGLIAFNYGLAVALQLMPRYFEECDNLIQSTDGQWVPVNSAAYESGVVEPNTYTTDDPKELNQSMVNPHLALMIQWACINAVCTKLNEMRDDITRYVSGDGEQVPFASA